jgi:phosphohistidine swiveling domain-containing protein
MDTPLPAVSDEEVRAAWAMPYPSTPYDIWTRTNVGEVFANAVTPFTWSVYRVIAEATFLRNPERIWLIPKELLRDGQPPLLIRAINGRLFFNTGLIYHIATEYLGLPSWFFIASLGGPQVGERLKLAPRGLRPLRFARALPDLLREQRRLEGVIREFQRTARSMREDARRLRRDDLSRLDLPALLARLDRLTERAGAPYRQVFDGSSAALNTYGLLAELCARWLDDRALANDLVTGLSNLLTAQASAALWQVARAARGRPRVRRIIETAPPHDLRGRLAAEPEAWAVAAALDRFFDAHGHRAVDEFELAVPRWSEDPAFVQSTLRAYLDAPPEMAPSRHLERQRARRAAAERRARRGLARGALDRVLPWRRLVFREVLRRTRRLLPMRENPKYHFLLYAAEMRRTGLALGGRLVAAGVITGRDDVFFLARAELDRAAAGDTRDLRPLVTARRALHARFNAWEPPEIIAAGALGAAESSFISMQTAAETAGVAETAATVITTTGGRLMGIAASSGTATGRARVALTAEEGAALEPGEILVAPFTDPGWTPLFPVAGAIVMDLGGLLSHGAIVAREYGIPAVVNTRTATTALRTGQIVTVNGDTGEVTWKDER